MKRGIIGLTNFFKERVWFWAMNNKGNMHNMHIINILFNEIFE